MNYFLYTIAWMSWNIFLALIPLLIVWLILKYKNSVVRLLMAILWLLFFPNTLYLLTDLRHIPKVLLRLTGIELYLSLFMFLILVVLGILTYIYSVYPLEKKFLRNNEFKYIIIFGLNLLNSFGLVLGRIFRYNSWDAFIKPLSILHTSIEVLLSPYYLLYILIFSIISSFIYILYTSIFHKRSS